MNDHRTAIQHFEWYYEKGYITARDGNCMWVDDNYSLYWVTGTGTEKQKLKWGDFVTIDKSGNVMERPNQFDTPTKRTYNHKPSIETGAHFAALKESGKRASVHVHSPNTVALAALFEDRGGFKPQSHNLVEVLNTKWPELFRYTKVGYIVPFLEPGSKKLHDCIVGSLGYWVDEAIYSEQTLNSTNGPEIIGLEEVKKWKDICIMQRHGVLAIGDTLDECMEHITRLEHISTILLKIITASGSLESIL